MTDGRASVDGIRSSIDPTNYQGIGLENAPTSLYGKLECLVSVGPLTTKGGNKLHISYLATVTTLAKPEEAAAADTGTASNRTPFFSSKKDSSTDKEKDGGLSATPGGDSSPAVMVCQQFELQKPG